ncbi:MAG: hypothetical protein AUJ97_04025 [Bacteroidetes bacterium CG2_30_32_10]|nr:MAG: hypothetical protein AUJ97_04025 [Bacteroidetes bacterium CG2_30_32_10]
MKIKKNIAISDSGFIFNPSTGESFTVNPIGVEIITLLKEDKVKEDIKKQILDKYQTEDIVFEKDYYDFVGMLNHYHLAETNEEEES